MTALSSCSLADHQGESVIERDFFQVIKPARSPGMACFHIGFQKQDMVIGFCRAQFGHPLGEKIIERDCRTWYRHVQQELRIEEAEVKRQRLVAEETERRKKEQEEEIRRTLQSVDEVFGDDNISNSGAAQ